MKIFKRIYIEVTNHCNLRCSFCPPSKRQQAFMDLASFESVLKKLEGHGEYVYLHVKGEPMLHPDFFKMLDLCEVYGLKVNLTTNGTLIGNDYEALLNAKALRQISISLQSQENLASESAFKTYLKNVMGLIQEGRASTDMFFELRLWNYDEKGAALQEENNQLALSIMTKELQVSKEVVGGIQKGKGIKLMSQVYLSKSAQFQWPDIKLDIIDAQGTCYGLRQQVAVLVNGDVVPCCLDAEGGVVLGNIFEESFESIVTSQRAVKMVDGFERREIIEPLCMRCGYRSRFS